MTEYNKLFREAFDRIEPQGDDKSFSESIIERKIAMKTNDGFERRELHEITVPQTEVKSRKAPWITAIAGFTAAAAGLGFFAGTRLGSTDGIELSPLSHPGYSQNAAAETEGTSDFKYIFQSYNENGLPAETYSKDEIPDYINGLCLGTYGNEDIMIDVMRYIYDYKTMEIYVKPHEGYAFENGYELALLYSDEEGIDHSIEMKPDEAILKADVSIPPYEAREFKLVYMPVNSTPTEEMTVAYFRVKGEGLMTEPDSTSSAEYTTVVMDAPDNTTEPFNYEDPRRAATAMIITEWNDNDDNIYNFSDISIKVKDFEYDGLVFKCDYEVIYSDIPNYYADNYVPNFIFDIPTNDYCRSGGILVKNDRNFTIYEFIKIPDGEFVTVTMDYIPVNGCEEGPAFSLKGATNDVRNIDISKDLTDFGFSDTTFDSMTLSNNGLELRLTSDSDICKELYADKINITMSDGNEITLNPTDFNVCAESTEEGEKYDITVNCTNYKNIDMNQMKTISVFDEEYRTDDFTIVSYN